MTTPRPSDIPAATTRAFETANKNLAEARRLLRPAITAEIPRTDDVLGPERPSYRRVVEAARNRKLPVRFVFEVTGLKGELFPVVRCTITDDGGRIRVDLDEGQLKIVRACGFEDDEERGVDWMEAEAVRAWLRRGLKGG